jgi:hypothetical protein
MTKIRSTLQDFHMPFFFSEQWVTRMGFVLAEFQLAAKQGRSQKGIGLGAVLNRKGDTTGS